MKKTTLMLWIGIVLAIALLSSTQLRHWQTRPTSSVSTTSEALLDGFSLTLPDGFATSTLVWEGTEYPGNEVVSRPAASRAEGTILISVVPSPISALNPAAKALSDYDQGYPVSDFREVEILTNAGPVKMQTREEVVVHSNERLIVNGISMLWQTYSQGYWSQDFNGRKIFDTQDETGINREVRYVFSDGEHFVTLSAKDAEAVDQLARTVKLLK